MPRKKIRKLGLRKYRKWQLGNGIDYSRIVPGRWYHHEAVYFGRFDPPLIFHRIQPLRPGPHPPVKANALGRTRRY